MGKLILEGYMIKIANTGYYLGVSMKTRMPTIFFTREEAEKQEVIMHIDPVNSALETKIVKVEIRENDHENIHRRGQRSNGNYFSSTRGKVPRVPADSSKERTELH